MVTVDLGAWELFALNIVYAAVILGVGWFSANMVRSLLMRLARTRSVDIAVSRFLASLVQYGVLAAAVIAALDRVGVASTSFVALLGSAGIAIGLALQGDLSNFASGVMILLYRPFDIGDVITAADQTGQVTDIGLFATRLSTRDRKIIIIPNSKVSGGTIVNLTASGIRRGGVSVGVGYGVDVQAVMAELKAAAETVDVVHADPAPVVTFDDLGASALQFTVYGSCDTANYAAMMTGLREAIYNRLNASNIEIPYNQLVLHHANGQAPARNGDGES